MVKGVNKQVVEVTDTGNRYIQKAILFIHPEKSGYDPDFIVYQAKKYLQAASADQQPQPKKSVGKAVAKAFVKIGSGAAIGATLTALLLK